MNSIRFLWLGNIGPLLGKIWKNNFNSKDVDDCWQLVSGDWRAISSAPQYSSEMVCKRENKFSQIFYLSIEYFWCLVFTNGN